ncbi:ADYC domain-containing protein [Hyalangium gracile]|uniref:ADYC domain-containing protein n=1 Tax=Hyalangium gracile TaxID=394092 RepID=UPI001CCADFDB|nr:ADYC domain-containing protein [Hyalangium gracile]
MIPLTRSTRFLLASLSLLLSALAFAEPSTPKQSHPAVAQAADSERYSRRCQSRAPSRGGHAQGTMLWGTRQTWGARAGSDEQRSVLVSVDVTPRSDVGSQVAALTLKDGRLVASPDASLSLTGTVLQGTSSDGKPMEIAICGAEPSPEDPSMVWYRIEAWNPVAQDWENPCVATRRVPDPRALAVSGVWDESGARHDAANRFTLACETGVISKCITWGYKPWASHKGQSLSALHQACTRMARADYCGNGRTHTRADTLIDVSDQLGLLTPTTEASATWNPALASFEADWTTDGATCLAHTRDGRALETILQECPERLRATTEVERAHGSRCAARREGVTAETALLRNQSYGEPRSSGSSPRSQ